MPSITRSPPVGLESLSVPCTYWVTVRRYLRDVVVVLGVLRVRCPRGFRGGPFLYSFTLDEEGRQPVAHAPDALDLAALAVLQEDLVF